MKKYIKAALFVLAAVVLDQVTKLLAVANLKDQDPFVLIPGVFELHYLENRGAAFGIFQDQQIFFIISAVVIFAAVLYFYKRIPEEKKFLPLKICSVLVCAGAIGNMIDRLRLGYVIDFFYFELIDFPIFNVADIYVTVTAVLLVLLILFYYKEEDLDQIFQHRK